MSKINLHISSNFLKLLCFGKRCFQPEVAKSSQFMCFTRELPGVALMNISNGQIYMENGNTFIYWEIYQLFPLPWIDVPDVWEHNSKTNAWIKKYIPYNIQWFWRFAIHCFFSVVESIIRFLSPPGSFSLSISKYHFKFFFSIFRLMV